MTTPVHLWWQVLCVVAVLNCVAWFFSARTLARRRNRLPVQEYRYRRCLMWLSAGYVAGCAFRSILPRIDLERICLVHSWLSSMVVGRSVATIAELCLIAQCALLLRIAGRAMGHALSVNISYLLLPLIVIAECASWYAILSTDYLGHVVENSIWTACAMLLFASLWLLWPQAASRQRKFLTAMLVFAGSYILFMIVVDVPMYWSRWQRDVLAGTTHLSLLQGFAEASASCVVSFAMEVWREEIPWMTLYFTVAVWVSILLPLAPQWNRAERHVK